MFKHSIYKNAREIVYNQIIITGRMDFRYIKKGDVSIGEPILCTLSDSCYRMIHS